MKAILTSRVPSLFKVLKSEDFQVVNNELDHNCIPTKYTRLGGAMPTKGSFMYFYDNHYNPVVVRVSDIVYGEGPTIFCEPAMLHDVEPYIFREDDKISKAFFDEVTQYEDKNKCTLAIKIREAELEYGEDVCKINVCAMNIMEGLKLEERSVIDHTNLMYVVCEILSIINKEDFGEWHRPYPWEYSDF